jgi:RimJ/RimL family protein N-acetyltransferase
MTLADLKAVLDVQSAGAIRGLAQVFPQERFPFPRSVVGDRWRRELADPMVDCFVVTSGGAVAGFLAVRRDELLHFGIATDLWGSGLASAAHDAFIDLLARRGLRRTWTLVFRDNFRGRRFYEKLGWEPTGERTQSTFAPHAELLRYQRAVHPGSCVNVG